MMSAIVMSLCDAFDLTLKKTADAFCRVMPLRDRSYPLRDVFGSARRHSVGSTLESNLWPNARRWRGCKNSHHRGCSTIAGPYQCNDEDRNQLPNLKTVAQITTYEAVLLFIRIPKGSSSAPIDIPICGREHHNLQTQNVVWVERQPLHYFEPGKPKKSAIILIISNIYHCEEPIEYASQSASRAREVQDVQFVKIARGEIARADHTFEEVI